LANRTSVSVSALYNRSATAGAAAGGTPEAVVGGDDATGEKFLDIERRNVAAGAALHRHAQSVVEIAVVKRAIVADVDLVAAHQAIEGHRVESVAQDLHVALRPTVALQVMQEAADGHVGNADQPREADAEAGI